MKERYREIEQVSNKNVRRILEPDTWEVASMAALPSFISERTLVLTLHAACRSSVNIVNSTEIE